jgi:hypothetical protein
MFDVIYFHAVMLVRYVMSLIKATYLLTYLCKCTSCSCILLGINSCNLGPIWLSSRAKLDNFHTYDSLSVNTVLLLLFKAVVMIWQLLGIMESSHK